MWKLFTLFTILILAFTAACIALIYFAIDQQPQIEREILVTPEHIARAKQLLDTHRYQVYPGKSATAKFQPDDLDIALNYLAHHFAQGRARATVQDQSALIQLSLPVPVGNAGSFLNIQAVVAAANGRPMLESVQIGKLPVPDALANLLISQLLTRLQKSSPDVRAALEAFRKLQISRNGIAITYYWEGWGTDQSGYSSLSAPLFNQQQLDRLLRYHHFLNEHNRHQAGRSMPLSELLMAVMRETVRHNASGNIVEEIRAAVLVTAFHVLQFPLRSVIPETASWPNPVRIRVTLDGRADFAMHFMASTAITAYTDTILSDAIGLYKELEDARSGSGFSFNDIAANRSGTRFAEKILANPTEAQAMRNKILSGIEDTDLIPYWSDLPEHMSESTFKARFGGIDSPQYIEMMDKIERRVASMRLLR
ncbi:hypothetical protein [Nitrosomonas sp. ANs5]|uniref:hypothetical protein n=1 Tax=Nitrosomonas sp. ANs5 TaxID=3423941 RepID=UPI003D3529EB